MTPQLMNEVGHPIFLPVVFLSLSKSYIKTLASHVSGIIRNTWPLIKQHAQTPARMHFMYSIYWFKVYSSSLSYEDEYLYIHDSTVK